VSIQKAPLDGYDRKEIRQSVELSSTRENGLHHEVAFDSSTHYVIFRVRTVRNEEGEIIGAHYGKIYSPMEIAPTRKTYEQRGGDLAISGILYFNPEQNNRSLEFNKKNLHRNPPPRGSFAY